MSIYDKPVRALFHDMIEDIGLAGADILTRDQVLNWFHEHYPKIKDGTLAAHLIKMSTNAPSRPHYKAGPADDLLFQIDSQQFRRYDPTTDPQPIYSKAQGEAKTPDDDGNGQACASEFAYERDLQNFLAQNLHLIEPGLSLYEEEDITGLEFPVGGRRIDLLAVDKAGSFVVIELKVSRGYDRALGQLLRYMAWIRKHQAESVQDVRGIIIAREISEDLRLACSEVGKVRLYEYALSVSLAPVWT